MKKVWEKFVTPSYIVSIERVCRKAYPFSVSGGVSRMKAKHAMPVLEALADRAAETFGASCKDTVVLHVNHCMDNSFYFSQILNRLFLRAVFVGVPYNDMAIGKEWDFIRYYGKRRRDVYELWHEEECFCRGLTDFMETAETLIEQALKEAVLPYLEAGKKVLILEDGGYHYPVLRRFLNRYPQWRGQICGSVEQTASGTVRCREFGRKYGYAYPCVSISRSDIKMNIEARFIGHRVVEELAGFLYTANTFLDFHHVLLLGYGIIGRQIAMDLGSRRCRISVYEKDQLVRRTAVEEGYEAVEISEALFQKDTIIIGNTGTESFTREMLAAFFRGEGERLYLASSSSQDKEFKVFLNIIRGKESLPESAILEEQRDEEFYSCCIYRCHGRKKAIYLIAEGLPVNFYRKGGISLTYSVIELIFAEMLSVGLALTAAGSEENVCGAGFNGGRQWEKRLWLLGEEGEAPCFLSEEELIRLWFDRYGLVDREEAKELLLGHPAGAYLRSRMFSEKNSGGQGEV